MFNFVVFLTLSIGFATGMNNTTEENLFEDIQAIPSNNNVFTLML